MQDGLNLFDILLLIALAVFIFTRFSAHQLPKDAKKGKKKNNVFDFPQDVVKNVTEVTGIKTTQSEKEALSDMDQLKSADRSFNEKDFLKGAKAAYEMYYEAFSSADEETLDELTAPRLFDRVMENIEEAEGQAEELKVDVHRIEKAEIVDVRVHGRSAIIDVKYVTEMAEYTQNSEGDVVAGKKDTPKKVTQIWTWARALDSDDLNWELEDINAVS